MQMISIHKALAGLDLIKDGTCIVPDISIHKALAGLDKDVTVKRIAPGISIHKALAGLDSYLLLYYAFLSRFQSTRPSRASTG